MLGKVITKKYHKNYSFKKNKIFQIGRDKITITKGEEK